MSTPRPEYMSFANLARSHREGRDFHRIIKPINGARVAVIAPHGGRIEPHTDAIATTLAGNEFSLYCFISSLPSHEANLHITSHRFDDSECLSLIEHHEFVVAVHGWARKGEAIAVGGRDADLKSQLAAEARALGVATDTDSPNLAGTDPMNICNRGKTRRGVQLELTMALRQSTKLLSLLSAFRTVLLDRQDTH